MGTRRGLVSLSACCVALMAASCGENQESAGDQQQAASKESGLVIAAVTAPANTKCLVITETGSTNLTFQYNVSAEQSSTFNLSGLPEGNDTFSAAAYSAPCASISMANETYVSDPVGISVSAYPSTLTLYMRPISGATGTVSVNFPNPPGTLAEFTVPTSNAGLEFITVGPDGNVYFTENNNIGQISPWGYISEFSIPTAGSGATGITTGPDGNIWFAESGANKIGRMAIGTGTFAEYPIPTASANPQRITTGPDGNLWFVETHAAQIGRITPSGAITEFALSAPDPTAIVAGPDGNLWFTVQGLNLVGRMAPTGSYTFFGVTQANDIAVGPDGNLWLGQTGEIGKMTTGAIVTEYSGTGASFITPGNDGTMWFGGGSITTAGVVTLIPLSAAISQSVMGSDGNIWATEPVANKIARITP